MKFYFISNYTIIFKPSRIFILFLLFHIRPMEALMHSLAVNTVILMSNYLISIFTSVKTTRLQVAAEMLSMYKSKHLCLPSSEANKLRTEGLSKVIHFM